ALRHRYRRRSGPHPVARRARGARDRANAQGARDRDTAQLHGGEGHAGSRRAEWHISRGYHSRATAREGRRDLNYATGCGGIMSGKERHTTEGQDRCPHCGNIMPGSRGIPLDVAQELYAREWKHKPGKRWLSEEARRLKCYHRAGRRVFILAKDWDRFLEEAGQSWVSRSTSESTGKRTARASSTPDTGNRTATKKGKSQRDVLKEALTLAKG